MGCGASDGPIADAGPVGTTIRGAQCGPSLDFEPVNASAGTIPWLQQREESVAFINGNCTGMYLGAAGGIDHLVLTAGHCVALGDEVLVAFNFELEADGPQASTLGEVVEWSETPDYALIALPEDPQVAPVPVGARPTRALTMIHHPTGRPKVVAVGVYSHVDADRVHYADLDTLTGSSGAGVFNSLGAMIGIHAGGDCQEEGTNWGWHVSAIVRASDVLAQFVIDDC